MLARKGGDFDVRGPAVQQDGLERTGIRRDTSCERNSPEDVWQTKTNTGVTRHASEVWGVAEEARVLYTLIEIIFCTPWHAMQGHRKRAVGSE